MSLELHLQANTKALEANTAALEALRTALAVDSGASAPQGENAKSEAAKPTQKAEGVAPAANPTAKPTEVATTAKPDAQEGGSVKSGESLTEDELRKVIVGFASQHENRRGEVVAILKSFGVSKGSEITDPALRAQCAKKIQAL